MWHFNSAIQSLSLKDRTMLWTFFYPWGDRQQWVFGISPWANFFLGHRKNWWVCLVVFCPWWPSVPCKTGQTKTATGHLYYAVFPVIYHCAFFSFLFKLFLSSVGLSVLNIVILLLKKKNFKQGPFFIWQFTPGTYIASEELQRWTD